MRNLPPNTMITSFVSSSLFTKITAHHTKLQLIPVWFLIFSSKIFNKFSISIFIEHRYRRYDDPLTSNRNVIATKVSTSMFSTIKKVSTRLIHSTRLCVSDSFGFLCISSEQRMHMCAFVLLLLCFGWTLFIPAVHFRT